MNISEPLYNRELNPNHGWIQLEIKYSEIKEGCIAFIFTTSIKIINLMHCVVSKYWRVRKSKIKCNNGINKINNFIQSNILLLPCILIRYLYDLFLMTNPYLQECFFWSDDFNQKRPRDYPNENGRIHRWTIVITK